MTTSESIPQVLARISRDRRFWLMLAGKAALMTVGQFISFIPLYLNTGKDSLYDWLCVCVSPIQIKEISKEFHYIFVLYLSKIFDFSWLDWFRTNNEILQKFLLVGRGGDTVICHITMQSWSIERMYGDATYWHNECTCYVSVFNKSFSVWSLQRCSHLKSRRTRRFWNRHHDIYENRKISRKKWERGRNINEICVQLIDEGKYALLDRGA